MHEPPRRILILKTEGSRFAFSDYVFPGEVPYEVLSIAREVLNLTEDKIKLYDELEKGLYLYIHFKKGILTLIVCILKDDIHIMRNYQI